MASARLPPTTVDESWMWIVLEANKFLLNFCILSARLSTGLFDFY
jgi:hypothetical protein